MLLRGRGGGDEQRAGLHGTKAWHDFYGSTGEENWEDIHWVGLGGPRGPRGLGQFEIHVSTRPAS